MTYPKVGVLDYGSGNLHSVMRALSLAGAQVELSTKLAVLKKCSGLVVPGVGAFAACMNSLKSVGGDDLVRSWVDSGRNLLGICCGQQILFSSGNEHGIVTDGLNIISGQVTKIKANRLPHMGWNKVESAYESKLFKGINNELFYFVHSYAAHETNSEVLVSKSRHEDDVFVAAIEYENIFATQFHPEKSGIMGGRLLANWLALI